MQFREPRKRKELFMSFDLYQEITNQIVAMLERGVGA
jgi:antirestriction protein ArdC